MKKPLEIFKPGSHIAASGKHFDFSESDVQAIVDAYDPALHEAPLVIGHPKHNNPAYGWVYALSFSEGVLCAEPIQVDPAFAEMVEAGRFKKISASFYAPGAPNNPVPDGYYLRHVGFLGAQPPAVKGLRQPEFNEDEEGVLTIEFSEESRGFRLISRMFRRVREWMIEAHGQEKADELLPDWQIEDLQGIANRTADDKAFLPAFGEPKETKTQSEGDDMAKTKEEIEALEAENQRLKAREAEFAEREAELAEKEKKRREAANADFCEALKKDGRLHPGQQANAVAILNALDIEQTVDFSEGEKTEAKPMADAFKSFLEAQPQIVDLSEAGGGNTEAVDMEDPEVRAQKITEFVESEASKGRTVSVVEAARQIGKQARQA